MPAILAGMRVNSHKGRNGRFESIFIPAEMDSRFEMYHCIIKDRIFRPKLGAKK